MVVDRAELPPMMAATLDLAIIDLIPAPIAIVAADGAILKANDAWRGLVGGTAGDPCAKVCGESAAVAVRRVASGSEVHVAFEVIGGPQTDRWLRVEAKHVGSGGIGAALLAASDVTAEKVAEARAIEQSRKLASVGEAIEEGIVFIDVDESGRYHFAGSNEQMTVLTGMTSAQMQGPVDEVAPRDSAQRIIAHCDEAIRTRNRVIWSARTRYRAGEIHAQVSVVPRIDPDGRCRHLVASVRDISALTLRDEALRRLEDEAARQFRSFNTAVSELTDFVYLFDRDARLVYGNKRMLDLLQITSDQLAGRTLAELNYPAELAERLDAEIRKVVETRETVRGETPFTSPANGTRYYEYLFHPVIGTDGAVEMVAGVSRDITDRRATEDELRQHVAEQRALARSLEIERKRLADAQAVAKIGSWVMVHATNELVWSRETYRIFGIVPLPRPLGFDDWNERVHPDDREWVNASFRRSLEERTPYLIEHRIIGPDGSIRWVQERCETEYSADGAPLVSTGTSQDVTERKLAEAELARSQYLLRLAARLGQIGGWEVDLATQTVTWSDEVCEIHGMPHGFQPDITTAIDFYVPEHRDLIRRACELCMTEGTSYDEELQIVDTNEQRIWVRSIGEAVRDASGQIVAIRGAFQNISEWKKALGALRASDDRFRLAAQATSDVIWDWDIANDVCWWSEGLQTQFGYPPGQTTPLQFWIDNIHPDDRPLVIDGFWNKLDSGEVWVHEYRFCKADGSWMQVIDRGRVALDELGQPYRMVGAMIDVTRQRSLEKQLAQVSRVSSLGQLAANMAHEFNNVLMSIQPFAELIRRAAPGDERIETSVSLIRRAVDRGRNVTEEILRFTRGVDPVKRALAVTEWLDGFRVEAEALLGGQQTFESAVSGGSLYVHGDLAQLNQVLANLVINSRDASPAGGTIRVTASRCNDERFGCSPAADFVHVTITDAGPGIPPEVLERIFDPLFTTKPHGTGLGLAICHQVVTAHGGRIVAENAPGGGAAFHLLLPIATAPQIVAGVDHVRPVRVPERVLIVEDEEAVAQGLAAALIAEGSTVMVVREGRCAADAVRKLDPDVVLLDIGLPDISGIVVSQQILAEWPSRKIVFMTGHLSRTELDALLARPHVGFLEKPFTISDLLATFATV